MKTIGFVGWAIILGGVMLFLGIGPFSFFAMLSTITGMWLIRHKIRLGFVFITLGCAVMVMKAIIHHDFAMTFTFGTLAVMAAMNFKKWGVEK